jgi:hypothetical protein
MENNPAGLYKKDTLKDCFKRADELSSPDGSRHTGMMCDRKDLRRIVLLVKTVRDLQMKLHGVVADAKQSESNFAIPVVSVAKHTLPRPLEAYREAQNKTCGEYVDWFLKEEKRGNAL